MKDIQQGIIDLFSFGNVIIIKWRNESSWPIEFISENVTNILGYHEEEFLNDKLLYSSLIHPDDRHRVTEEVKSFSQKKASFFTHEPYRLITKDNKVIWVKDSTRIIYDESGNLTHYFGYLLDITELQNSKNSYKFEKERFELALKGTSDGLWDWDIEKGTLYLSKQWKLILGYEEDEVFDHFSDWSDRVHPEDLEETQKELNDYLKQKTHSYKNVHRLRCKNGHYKWILSKGKALFNSLGQPVRMLGFHVDLTEKIDLEQKLEYKNTIFDKAQQIAHIGHWHLNLENNDLIWSDEVYRIFGLEPQEFESTYEKFIEFVHPGDREKVGSAYSKSLENKESYEIEHRVVQKNGDIRYVVENCHHSFDENGNPFESIGTVIDITDRKRIQDDLMIEKSRFSELGRNIDMVAHQWKQPLNVVSLLTAGLNEVEGLSEEASKEIQMIAEKITKQVFFMSSTVTDFRTYVDTSNKDKSFLLEETVQEVLSLLETLFMRNSIEVKFTTSSSYPVFGKESDCRHVIYNILTNAQQALSRDKIEKPIISIDLVKIEENVELNICDNGLGVKKSMLPEKLFELNETTTTENGGSGVGLGFSKLIIEDRMKGKIFASNLETGGACFKIKLPLID